MNVVFKACLLSLLHTSTLTISNTHAFPFSSCPSTDGIPPSLPLTQSTVGLYHITVTWSLNVTLPSNGPISSYIATVYNTSDELVYSATIEDGSVSQYTFTNLQPSTTYRLSVVGVNSYGEGSASPTLLQATTQSPIGKQ